MIRKNLKKIILPLSLIIILLFAIPAILIIIDGLNDEIGQADVAVVLGNTVQSDGNPSPRLQARLDKTIELYQKGFFPNIIVSGGFGVEGFDEAVVMRQYLINHNVPAENIYLDREGKTTNLTAKNSARIMKEHNWQSAMIISQYFHISRTRLAFSNYGISRVFSAHANYFELRDLYSLCREIIGYFSYLLRGSNE
ncbi:MAG: YdcF family protein [Pyrinomonadaceae bacterium]|nr:YdcF family protein [Pyrinomonadaceae bacterium]